MPKKQKNGRFITIIQSTKYIGGVAEWMKSKLLCFSSEQSEVASAKPHFSKTCLVLDDNTKYIGGVAE
ncbi:MAG: hypothetical protein KAV41_03375, partial [Candidatus Pacebacteria bacterium]|nr:hypothetical protein [Candidatus Paceibacterota bacterium]